MAIAFTPLHPSIGAEVKGLDIRNITEEVAKQLHEGWLRYHVLLVRGPVISDDELVRFGQCFGPVENARKRYQLATRPEIMVISNIRENGEPVGALPDGELSFHFDRIHQKIPNKAGILHALEIPTAGGDTWFANTCLAYDELPAHLKLRLSGLTALNTYEYGQTRAEKKQLSGDSPAAIHPVVRTIPETGRKAVYVCRLMTDRINELLPEESRELLESLCMHIEDTRFIYKHHWLAGDILVWDNRCTIHARTDFDAGERRLLKRITVRDEVPPAH